MKKTLFLLLVFTLLIFLTACETSSNEKTDLTISKENQEDDAVKLEETVLTWPREKLSISVPKLKKITITDITDIENGVLITFVGCDEDETKKYTNQLKNAGWDFQTQNTEEGKTVIASKQNESLVFFSPIYDADNDIGSITYARTD